MKIYVLPVDELPPPKIRAWPPHSVGFTIEVDFLDFLRKHKGILTDNPDEADWHYLPFLWTYWFLSHDYGKTGGEELVKIMKEAILDDKKTFTISEYGDQPVKDIIGDTLVFASGWGAEHTVLLPLVSKPHQFPDPLPPKKYLASFRGKLHTHPIRQEMAKLLASREDVNISSGNGTEPFVHFILESYATLCPRGTAVGSYRFYESMQLGVAPIMVGEMDARPFKKHIRWDTFTYYVKTAGELPAFLDSLDKRELLGKGALARDIWYSLFWNQGWCQFVLLRLLWK